MSHAPAEGGPVSAEPQQQRSLVVKVADRYGIAPGRLLATLTATAFKTDRPATNEQLMALLIVADQYTLNPFTREIFAFPDKGGGIVPVVSLDGWVRIINAHPQLDGIEFQQPEGNEWCACLIHRKDRQHPTIVREFLAECRRNTPAWNTAPRRMLRHKALIQCARIAFGFGGIYDPDEGARVLASRNGHPEPAPDSPAQRVRAALGTRPSWTPPDDDGVIEQAPPEPDMGAAQYMRELVGAADADEAMLVLDRARGAVSESDLNALGAAYRAHWASVDPTTERLTDE